jgi:alpha-L-glutamate ligase-like protein
MNAPLRNPLAIARRLREAGLLGINRRNADYVLRYNPRRCYPRVDDKLLTKKLAIAAGLPVPELYAVVRAEHEIADLHDGLAAREDFVVKPAHGSGGDGILVIAGRRAGGYRRAGGQPLSHADFEHHLSNALSGLFSLGGQPDHLLVEYRVKFDPIFDQVSFKGVPDIRIIVFLGVPVMAMIRLPTRQSDGKANLHQGAIGVGIDLATGTTRRGVSGTAVVREHPDTDSPLLGICIPHWDALLAMAARCNALSGMDYIGVDFVLDRDRGPLILELNARPGLAIQVANGAGLLPRLQAVEALRDGPGIPAAGARVAWARETFATRG